MNYPHALNPLRGTRHAWLFPFAWAVIKCAAVTAPVTLEVFLHHRFGARTGKNLIKGFLLLLVIAPLFKSVFPGTAVPLFAGFIFAYVIAAICQWLSSRFGEENEHIDSYTNGTPWPLWQQFPFAATTIERFLEPALCFLVALVVLFLDPPLAHWLFVASIALFIKAHVRQTQLRTHQLDSLDSRRNTTQNAPRHRAENDAFVEARPAPPGRMANVRRPRDR